MKKVKIEILAMLSVIAIIALYFAIHGVINYYEAQVRENFQRVQLKTENADLAVRSRPLFGLRVEIYTNETLRQEIERLKKESKVAQPQKKEGEISVLQRKVYQLQKIQKEQNREIKKLRDKLCPNIAPVLFVNHFPRSIIKFKVVSQSTGKIYFIAVENQGELVFKLPPGIYTVECYHLGRKLKGIRNLIVTPQLSVCYKGKAYHGIARTFN